MVFHRPRLINVISFVLFAISAVILASVVAFTVNVDVLEDWKLKLPPGDIHVDDTVVVESTYTKLREVTGKAVRYLECVNTAGAIVRYPINEARADRAPGSRTGTGVIIKVPAVVPVLQAKCRISINVTYQVYPWRTVVEFQSTDEFTLLPSVAREVVSSAATQTSQSLSASQGLVRSNSYVENTSPAQAVQQDSSQPIAEPVSQPEPSGLRRVY